MHVNTVSSPEEPHLSAAAYFNLPLSVSWFLSAGTPFSRLGPVAMAIVRTHLESVTMAIGLPMSFLMSTALLSSFKVRVRFGLSHAWVH